MSLLLGIDLGTSYFKAGLFDSTGALKGLGRVAVETDCPASNRSELPVARFWALLRRTVAEALVQAQAKPEAIAAMSYSSQANSFVLLDAADQPLTPIVVWTDARAEPIPPELAEFSRTETFVRTVGFAGWTGGFAVPKWRWFQAHERERWGGTHAAMTLSDYVTFALTGERVGDASTAALLGLYDLEQRRWWPEALAVARVEAARLSRPLTPGTVTGKTVPRAVELLGLPAGVPFAVGGLDHHVAALGAGLGTSADVSISTGTVLAAMTRVPAALPCDGCFHGRDFDGTSYFRLAFNPAGAGQLEVYQREFGAGMTLPELLALAAVAPPGCAAPQDLGAAGHGSAMRYLLEKIAATHRELIRRVTRGADISRVVATGGGARSELWLQIKADMFGVPVITPSTPERACFGAAMLAAVAAGWYPDAASAMKAMFTPGRLFEPEPAAVAQYRKWKT
jgi:xylulokinase